MGTPVSQETWKDLVERFLKVWGPAGSRETEAALATCLPALGRCAARLRIVYDHRVVESVVSQCVSGVVPPWSPHAVHCAVVVVWLLRWPGGVRLSGDLAQRVVGWLGHTLAHHRGEEDTPDTVLQVLRALAAVLRDHPDHSHQIYESLCGREGSVTGVVDSDYRWRHKGVALQCLHLLTFTTPEVVMETRQRGAEIFPPVVVSSIQRVVIGILRQPPPDQTICPHKSYLRLVASSLSVLYNLVICAPNDVLGNIIVSACRPFIFYGLPGFAHTDLLTNTLPASVDIPLSSELDSDVSGRNYTNRNRRKRLRRKRAQPSRSTPDCDGVGPGAPLPPLASGVVGVIRGPPPPPATDLHTISLKPEWTRTNNNNNCAADVVQKEKATEHKKASQSDITTDKPGPSVSGCEVVGVSSSETDYSDLDSGGGGGVEQRESALTAQVRQCALQAINAVIDKVGGHDKFSYWAPLMCPGASLMSCVLRDPAPRARMAALQVINTFLMDSAQVLSLADDRCDVKSSYSTLGHQLGSSVRELHRCLARALLSERVPGALVRTLKTAELLVQNVNYSKLRPGLLTKLLTHVKYFMTYKEAVVRANAFSVMVSVLMVKPQVSELRHLLLRHLTPAPTLLPPSLLPSTTNYNTSLEEQLPTDEEDLDEQLDDLHLGNDWSENSSGVEDDTTTNKNERTMVSWLVRRCVDSLMALDTEAARGIYIQVQLQSLKVLSALVSEHLSLIQPSLPLIQHVISVCSEAGRDTHITTSAPRTPEKDWRAALPEKDWRAPPQVSPEKDWKATLQPSQQTSEKGWRNHTTPSETLDPSLTSPDPGAVVEHTYTLLGSLMGAVKVQLESSHAQQTFTNINTTTQTSKTTQPYNTTETQPLANITTQPLTNTTTEPLTNTTTTQSSNTTQSFTKTQSLANIKTQSLANIKTQQLANTKMQTLANTKTQPLTNTKTQPLTNTKTQPLANTTTQPFINTTKQPTQAPTIATENTPTSQINILSHTSVTTQSSTAGKEAHIHSSVSTSNSIAPGKPPGDVESPLPPAPCDPCPTSAAPSTNPALEMPSDPCLTHNQAHQLWLWALQGPLQPLLKYGELMEAAQSQATSGVDCVKVQHQGLGEDQVKQMVAMATVFTHLSPTVVEGLGELWMSEISRLLEYLLSPCAPSELRLAAIRIMAIAVGFPGLVGSASGATLVRGTTRAACDILLSPKDMTVNRDRLLAAWALANVTSVLDLYSGLGESDQGDDVRGCVVWCPVLPVDMTRRVVSAGLGACQDKDKIKTHGVRCVGNMVAWTLRTQHHHSPNTTKPGGGDEPTSYQMNAQSLNQGSILSSKREDVLNNKRADVLSNKRADVLNNKREDILSSKREDVLNSNCGDVGDLYPVLPGSLQSEAVEGLVGCAMAGSNMKTRWNACHALGSILAAADASLDHQPWRSQVINALSRLVEGFKNYKVRIQACIAVAGVGRREGYGGEYCGVWTALLRGLEAAQGIPHYQEARHKEDLINQICEGVWQITCVMTLEDAGALRETLELQQDVAGPLLQRAYRNLPPERTSHALRAQARVQELMAGDALTEDQQVALSLLEGFTLLHS